MPAVTVNSTDPSKLANFWVVLANIDIAANGDTYNTGYTRVVYAAATSRSANAIGATSSGGTITFVTGGAETGVKLLAICQA